MIPDFAENGCLPEGVHSATVEELRERFSYFDVSDQRLRVYRGLWELLDEAGKSGIVRRVVVAGSFVTNKSEPNDFDAILVLDPVLVNQTLRPREYNLVSRKMARRLYGGDVLSAVDGSAALEKYLKFFQTNRAGEPVGVVEIALC